MTNGYIVNRAWQIEAIRKAMDRFGQGDAKHADHEQVVQWLGSWGTDHELEPPECS